MFNVKDTEQTSTLAWVSDGQFVWWWQGRRSLVHILSHIPASDTQTRTLRAAEWGSSAVCTKLPGVVAYTICNVFNAVSSAVLMTVAMPNNMECSESAQGDLFLQSAHVFHNIPSIGIVSYVPLHSTVPFRSWARFELQCIGDGDGHICRDNWLELDIRKLNFMDKRIRRGPGCRVYAMVAFSLDLFSQ